MKEKIEQKMREHKVLTKFRANVKKTYGSEKAYYDYLKEMNVTSVSDTLMAAFAWGEAPEGWAFWVRLQKTIRSEEEASQKVNKIADKTSVASGSNLPLSEENEEDFIIDTARKTAEKYQRLMYFLVPLQIILILVKLFNSDIANWWYIVSPFIVSVLYVFIDMVIAVVKSKKNEKRRDRNKG